MLLFRARQSSGELRLPGENDLQQFQTGGFEVRELTKGFEQRIFEVLRLIDYHDHPFLGQSCVREQVIELAIQLRMAGFFGITPQLNQQRLQKLTGVVLLLEQKGRPGTSESFQEIKEQ